MIEYIKYYIIEVYSCLKNGRYVSNDGDAWKKIYWAKPMSYQSFKLRNSFVEAARKRTNYYQKLAAKKADKSSFFRFSLFVQVSNFTIEFKKAI